MVNFIGLYRNFYSKLKYFFPIIIKILQPGVIHRPITFAYKNSGLFNSWEDNDFRESSEKHSKHIQVFRVINTDNNGKYEISKDYFTWNISRLGNAASFCYKIDSNEPNSLEASSGGWITFYANSINITNAQVFRFDFKINVAKADVGIRLAYDDIDNLRSEKHKQLFWRELSSVRKYLAKTGEDTTDLERGLWFTLTIPIQENFIYCESSNLQENSINKFLINKVVFFVDNDIGNECKSAELCLKNIGFYSR